MSWAPAKKDFDAEYIRSRVTYDASTGEFYWMERPVSHFNDCAKSAIHLAAIWNAKHAFKRADRKDGEYRKIVVNKIAYKAHRIAYLYTTGGWPPKYIDHKNRDKSDNRFSNLRGATPSENRMNTKLPSNNTSGVRGVYWDKKLQKWKACIKKNRIQKHLGYFDRKEDAIEARANESKSSYGHFGG